MDWLTPEAYKTWWWEVVLPETLKTLLGLLCLAVGVAALLRLFVWGPEGALWRSGW